jgi:hypothetical protein
MSKRSEQPLITVALMTTFQPDRIRDIHIPKEELEKLDDVPPDKWHVAVAAEAFFWGQNDHQDQSHLELVSVSVGDIIVVIQPKAHVWNFYKVNGLGFTVLTYEEALLCVSRRFKLTQHEVFRSRM